MKGRKIINEFFKLVHQKYALGIPNFNDDVDGGLYSFDEIIDEFKTRPNFVDLESVKYLIEIFKEGSFNPDFLSDHLTPFKKIELVDFSDPVFKKRNRAFYFYDNNFGYFSFKKTFEENHLTSHFNRQGAAISNIQQFVSSCIALNQRQKIEEMLNSIKERRKDVGLLLQKQNHRRESIYIYSFTYFCYLCNGGVVEISDKLKYTTSSAYFPIFNQGNNYNQFFEVYDVINEVNQSKDIISRFLKVYHILEYLSYRVKLVDIEVKARERKTFIREITSLKKDNEESYIIDCFKKAFIADIPSLRTNLRFTNPLKQYIEKQFGISSSTFNSQEYIPKLIYRLRNSIVHNKESEFHITVSNPEEYKPMISLMQRMISNLERIFYNRMNIPQPEISYGSSVIQLY
ncbi:MAG TPA: hypothetical protein DEA97_21485 [Bacteroidales bacterium]|nr:MAG: hypothetical protein UR43_C0014G0010 [candidate division TM6 bacterium GW2011_GWF2_33_332]HBS89134.1 hypothetical protein [Bacteroidales bacterium]